MYAYLLSKQTYFLDSYFFAIKYTFYDFNVLLNLILVDFLKRQTFSLGVFYSLVKLYTQSRIFSTLKSKLDLLSYTPVTKGYVNNRYIKYFLIIFIPRYQHMVSLKFVKILWSNCNVQILIKKHSKISKYPTAFIKITNRCTSSRS